MKMSDRTICPPIDGVRTPTDIECFEMFNVEINEMGDELWSVKKIYERKDIIGKRELPQRQAGDTFTGEPGTTERIEALRAYYENQTDETSPF
jgi:hypothetical protein